MMSIYSVNWRTTVAEENRAHQFEPKRCTRQHAKFEIPIRLYDLCIKQLIKLYRTANSGLANQFRIDLFNNSPEIKINLIERAVMSCTATEVVKILDLLYLKGINTLNLWATSSLEFGFRRTNDVRFYGDVYNFGLFEETMLIRLAMNFEIKPDNLLNGTHLNNLKRILWLSSPLQLEKFAVAVEPNNEFHLFNLPGIFTRFLTNLTIRTGASDQILGVVGRKCHSLKFLDVSLSTQVTDEGIQELLIRQPSAETARIRTDALHLFTPNGPPTQTESSLLNATHFNWLLGRTRNKCANTLDTIVLTQTRVTYTGMFFLCQVLDTGYLLDIFPAFTKVFRLKGTKSSCLELNLTPWDWSVFPAQYPTMQDHQMRIYKEYFQQSNGAGIYLRQINLQINWILKHEQDQITTLIMYRFQKPLYASALARHFPHLKYLFGRIRLDKVPLTLEQNPEYKMHHLEVVNLCMCSKSNVVPFLLRFAPKLTSLRVLSVDEYLADDGIELNDTALRACLMERERHTWNLEDIVIVGSRHLTTLSLTCLIEQCPKLKRIGDLDSWEMITNGDIAEFNERLERINSQCVLSVLTYPATLREQQFHNVGMSFMGI